MIESVAAVLLNADHVFIVQRQPHLRAFPGYHAFPGGKIEAVDSKNAAEHALLSHLPPAHVNALHRELAEELDFDLLAAVSAGEVLEIFLFGTAVTPAFERTRFSAHYYKIVLDRKPEFKLDTNELFDGSWCSPGQINKQYRRGRALMVVPMCNMLLSLEKNLSARSADPFNVQVPEGELPCLELIDGLRTIPVPSNTLPPATTTNALLIGDRGARQVLVDPSPGSDSVYGQLMNTLSESLVEAILISHHHPDHHERAMDLAREKDVPVLLSVRTLDRITARYGRTYCKGVSLEIVGEGSEISRWKGEVVRAYDLPGHDDGMLGLAPDSLSWFFIADLAQSNGSIVIPEKEGDLADYLASLNRVIGLNPAVVLPSHGIPSGGTGLLQRTLAHRIDREEQIRPFFKAGAGTQEILDSVYPDVERRLRPLAVQTINQHIRKLKADSKN